MPDIIAKMFFAAMLALIIAGCAGPKSYDYMAYRQSNPKSILVLPPLNNSPDVKASYTFMSVATRPLAEAGYYVFPVALVDQTFKENGLTEPALIHQAPLDKLYKVFAADAVLYITVDKFGTSYSIIKSETKVTAHAKLVDGKTGDVLWSGSATASSKEGQDSGISIAGLVGALINQITSNIGTDPSLGISFIASERLLSPNKRSNGVLFGPRSPSYGKDKN